MGLSDAAFEVTCPDCGGVLKIDSLFAQSVQAEKNRDDLLDKRFAEALKKAKETPGTGKPLRDFDLE